MRTLTLAILLACLPAWAGRNFNGPATNQLAAVVATNSLTVPLTFAAWFKPSYSPFGCVLSACTTFSSAGYGRFQMFYSGTLAISNRLIAATSSDTTGGENAYTANQCNVGAWNHGAAVFASETSRTPYLNGTAGTNGTVSVVVTNSPNVIVGVRWQGTTAGFGTSGWFDGDIADAAIWNVALTAAEIASLAAGASPLTIRPQSLVFYAPMTGESTTTEVNLIGPALSLSNSPARATSHPRIFNP